MKKSIKSAEKGWAVTGILSVFFLTIVDQLCKVAAIQCLKGQKPKVLIPGVLELMYLENRGMAFGMLQGKICFFVAVCVLFLAGAAYVYRKIPKERYYYPLLFIILILGAGALGNFIDRIFRGFVVDYIYISLIDFPVFNLADIFVVCGGVLLLIFVFFKYKDDDFEFLKSAKKDD